MNSLGVASWSAQRRSGRESPSAAMISGCSALGRATSRNRSLRPSTASRRMSPIRTSCSIFNATDGLSGDRDISDQATNLRLRITENRSSSASAFVAHAPRSDLELLNRNERSTVLVLALGILSFIPGRRFNSAINCRGHCNETSRSITGCAFRFLQSFSGSKNEYALLFPKT